jgi:hypothetical protein
MKLLFRQLAVAVKESLAVLTQNVDWPQTNILMATVQLKPGISARGYLHKENTVPSTYVAGFQQVSTKIRPSSINKAGTPVTVLMYFIGVILNCW